MAKQKFSDDFKNTIVDLYKSGKGVTELSREYGISLPTIYSWINNKKEVKIDSESFTKEQIIALQKENARLKEENDILKKATAIFAKIR
ncbi:MAG: transposase [Bacilli bacterium]